MAVTSNLAMTALMAVFLVAVVGMLARLRADSGPTTQGGQTVTDRPQVAHDVPARSAPRSGSEEAPITWVVGFVLLVVLAGAGSVAFIAGVPQISAQAAGVVLAVVLGGLLCGYLFSGVYLSVRSHGRKSAEATGVALWLLGLLVVGVIAAQLLFIA